MAHPGHTSLNRHSMISARNVVVTGGTLTQIISDRERKSSFEILKKNVSHTAFHNSAARFDPPKCHQNTRVAVLKKIMDWVHRTDWETWYRYIMWLTGAAGAGKSAIAQSIIELCLVEGLVIANFFFFRSDSTRNDGTFLIATLAYQIFFSVPSTQAAIISAIEGDPLIFKRTLSHQFDKLVIQPLREFYQHLDNLDEKWRRLIVIDGLDECLDRNAQKQILNMIQNAIRKYELPVMFLVASRPEHDISTVFSSTSMDGVFSQLYLDDKFEPDDDIRTFLRDSFEEIRTNHPFPSKIPALWPTPESVECIVRKSSGQFIFAATAVRYVQSNRHRPQDRLDVIMNLQPPQKDLPFAELDALYTMILSSAADIDRVLYALSIYSLNVTYKEYNFDISEYMSLDDDELEVLFCDLRALVSLEWNEEEKFTELKILHASLHDYLLDASRSKQYFISLDAYRTVHLADILRYIVPKPWHDLDWDLIAQRAMSVYEFVRENLSICQISKELQDQAFNFPIEKVLHALDITYSAKEILYLVIFELLPFIRHMSYLNESQPSIEEQHEATLTTFFSMHMPSYHSIGHLSSLLCLTIHSGKAIFIPGIIDGLSVNVWIISFYHPSSDISFEGDMLLLHMLALRGSEKTNGPYRRLVTSFLQDPEQSGRYAVGPHTYANATLFFVEQLALHGRTILEPQLDENYLSQQLVLKDDIWELDLSDHSSLDEKVSASVMPFLLLGYVIFFLPLCEWSEDLAQHFQQQTFFTQRIKSFFPNRTALVEQAMEAYLARTEDGESG